MTLTEGRFLSHWVTNALLALAFACALWILTDRSIRQEFHPEIKVKVTTPTPDEVAVKYAETGRQPPRAQVAIKASRAAWNRYSESGEKITGTYLCEDEVPIDVLWTPEQEVAISKFDFQMPSDFEIVPGSFEPAILRFSLGRLKKGRLAVEVGEFIDVPGA
ncbi:hypothetical protein ACFL59_13835 [Planctomycetota bacterium]